MPKPTKESGLHFDADKGCLRVDLVNLTAMDCRFLRGVINIFADPDKKALAMELRRGVSHIQFSPGGYARVCVSHSEN